MGRLGQTESALCVHATDRRSPERRQERASGGPGTDNAIDSLSDFPDPLRPRA